MFIQGGTSKHPGQVKMKKRVVWLQCEEAGKKKRKVGMRRENKKLLTDMMLSK